MSEQENTPSVFRWGVLVVGFCAAFYVVKTVFELAFAALLYGGIALVVAGVGMKVIKKLTS